MPDLSSTFALLGLLLLARGFFALVEFAVRGAHKGRLQKLADADDARARQALATAGAPAPALSAARGCVTLTTLLLGALRILVCLLGRALLLRRCGTLRARL